MSHTTGLAVAERIPDGSVPGRPMVVLVHGSLDRSTSFTRVLRRLEDLHTVVYDRRGYHGSRAALPLAESLEAHIDDLVAVVGGRPAVVVGHSYGGDVALGAALRTGRGQSIVGVVAYEPPLPWMEFWASSGTTARGGSMGAEPAAAAERFYRRVVGNRAWERLSESARDERRADGPALVAEINAIRLEDAPFDVARLSVPAVFGRGELSVPHHREGVAWLAAATPGAELVEIAGARHGAHLTHPDAFADMVRRAVRAVDPSVSPAVHKAS